MGQVKALLDSNILIDFLQGNEAAREELDSYDVVSISRITWIEILIGAKTEAESKLREKLLAEFAIVELDARVGRLAVQLRRDLRLKLPDAIILASARSNGFLFVTRNHRDFPRKEPDIRIPY
jgi:predicted nucleic acid-binding protein